MNGDIMVIHEPGLIYGASNLIKAAAATQGPSAVVATTQGSTAAAAIVHIAIGNELPALAYAFQCTCACASGPHTAPQQQQHFFTSVILFFSRRPLEHRWHIPLFSWL